MVVTDLPFASLTGVWHDRDGLAVEMNGAGAAGGDAATEFRAGQPEFVAKIPEHRHRRIAVETLLPSVDAQSEHTCLRCVFVVFARILRLISAI